MSILTHDDYTIAWICALPMEVAAARVMLDKIHSPLRQPSSDPNAYELGELNGHYIVIASLPAGVYGTVSAAAVVSRIRSTFPRLQYALMVGFGGGVPSNANDIRLGDVVVSKPSGAYSGVIQYDYGKAIQGGIFESTRTLNKPPPMLLMHMSQLEARQMTEGRDAVSKIVLEVLQRNREMFSPPEQQMDLLFLLMSVVPVQRANPGLGNQKMRHWVVPFARNPKFVGRQRELAEIERMFSDGATRVGITGLGGVGKTQIALEMAFRVRERDKECSIFWVPCTSHAMIEQTLSNMAQTLGISDVTPAEAKERIKIYLSSERAGRWLLIFDNADDALVWLSGDNTGPALEDFIPQSEHGRIIFTSRTLELAVDLAFSNIIAIPDTDPETATQVLQKSLAQKELLNDRTAMAALLEQLEYLPLAIVQAAAYINKKGLGLSSYSTLLKETEEEAIELLSEDFRDPGRYRGMQNPVLTTWLISFNQIQQQDQLAADYLSFMACIHPRNIPASLLPSQAAKKQTDALGLLHAYSFINRQKRYISMHRLVHIASRNWLRKNGQFRRRIQQVAHQMVVVFPNDDHTNRLLWRGYLPHALALVREEEFRELQVDCNSLVARIADCLASDGRFYEAEPLYAQSVRVNEEKHGSEHPDTLTGIANLASTYWKQGRWEEAEKLEVQVLETRKIVLGVQHPDTLTSMANLASTYWDQGRWDEAEKLEVQVMEIMKTVLGVQHPNTLTSMANLALTYSKQERWDEAAQLQVQVMAIRKTVLGAQHPDTLTGMANLASTYWNQGHWDEAEKLEVQVMETSKTVLGAQHPDTLTGMANLASTYWNQGRWDEAEKLEVQVMETSKTVLGERHPDTLTSMANLASTYRDQGRWDEAERLEVQVMEIRKAVLGAQHPDTLTSMENLASTYTQQGRWDEAEKLNVQVMETRNLGIGDRIPGIWVGEVVANQTGSSHGWGVQYDFGNSTPSEFAASDVLFDPEYSQDDDDFLTRTTVETIKRKERADNTQTMHYSTTTSGSQVKRDGANRDKISLEAEDLCFEMEAAGLVDNSRALVVRGLSDYADLHKNKKWQSYAAGAAAAYLSDLLGVIPAADMADTKTGKEAVKFIQDDVESLEKVPKPMMAWSNLTPSHSQYQISLRRSLFTVVLDGCKSAVERVVGCQLSWWPWHEPEEKVQDGHTRVYSMAFRGCRFYNDIPTSFAEKIFPGLRDAGSSSLQSTFSILDQKSVLLHNTTLTNLLLNYQVPQSRARTTGEDQEAIAREDAERPTSTSSCVNLKPQEQLAPTGEGVEDVLDRTTHQQHLTLPEVAEGRIESSSQAWLYLSVDIGPNQSRARAVKLGENDKITFENIYTAYRSFTPKWCWWKQAAKIRFYRFQSFLFKEPRNCYYVHLHRDKERYPEATDPVYTEYRYMPQPWPSFIPYPSEEAWYYFWHPEDCGTSSDLTSKLPIRFRDAIARHALAFGMHVEERPSALAIFLMAAFVCFLALAATLWFIPRWLEKHPGDLQNATAPVVVAFAVVNIFISVATSLLIFRLTPR